MAEDRDFEKARQKAFRLLSLRGRSTRELRSKLKEKGFDKHDWRNEKVADLKISDYLTGPDTLKGAGLQDTLIFAMKKEQQSIEFYSKMMGALTDEAAKLVCEGLVHDELKHKLRLEIMYDDMFYKGD